MGAGLLLTLVAIIARFKIPESPRYTMDVLGNTFKASVDARDYRRQARDEQELQPMMNGNANANANPAPVYPKASYADAVNYFVTQGNWVYLLGATVSWFVLDFGKCDLSHNCFHIYLSSLLVNTHSNHHASKAFYGLDMNSPSTIAKIWDIAPPNSSAPTRWSTEYDPNLSVFQDLLRSGAHALVVVSLGAVVGGLLLILFINHLNRKRLQWGGFLALFVIFIILGRQLQENCPDFISRGCDYAIRA
jgi:PHS family inorganic phosphate transporter-like MFS transporter